ncbi:MAG: type III secretion system inner membrane ring subunit SctD, partial [Sutterella sp.]
MMFAAALRILSGVHLGAEIVLEEGTWAFGRDDSCDIILTDLGLSPRHCALSVGADGTVSVRPLDGTVLTAGDEEEPKSGVLKPGIIYKMGTVLFAWGDRSAPQSFWDGVALSLLQLSNPRPANQEKPAEPGKASETDDPKDSSKNTGSAESAQNDSSAEADGSEEGSAPSEEAPVRSHRTLLAGFTIALLLLAAGLFILFGAQQQKDEAQEAGEWVELREEPAALERAKQFVVSLFAGKKPVTADEILRRVHNAGFPDIRVTKAETGAFLIEGSVSDDAERGRLVSFARKMKVPVVIDVTVDSDYTTALQSSFNTIDFWPSVTLSKTDAGQELVVAAYMLSSVVEEKAFVEAERNVPFLRADSGRHSVPVTRRIRHQADVNRLLTDVLRESSLDGIKIDYLPGRVRLTTTLTPERRSRLEQAMEALRSRSDVPLRIDVVNQPLPAAAAPTTVTTVPKSVKPDTKGSNKPTFRVAGVSGGAIKFVTLSTGEKVF